MAQNLLQNSNQLEIKRHSLEHVMVLAVIRLFGDGIKLGVGPVISDGFYQDLDFQIKEDDLPNIEQEMRKIIGEELEFVHEVVSLDDAIELFKSKNQTYKVELLNDIKTKGTTKINSQDEESEEISNLTKDNKVSLYTVGTHKDLCRGPHVKNTKELKGMGFKLDRLAGAYWRGSEKNPMLTRIYGLAFNNNKDLRIFLDNRSQAEKRNHRKLGKELELFASFNSIGQGLPVWLPKGYAIRKVLEDYMYRFERSYGYEHILTPHINKKELFETSGHLSFYTESMYAPIEIDDETYYLKPMNCPAGMQVYKMKPRSYKDLPIKLGEFGTVYRYEKSGELHGLQRVRGFTQNDAHLFVSEERLESTFMEVFEMLQKFYKDLGFTNIKYRLSLRDDLKDKYVGEVTDWQKAENTLRTVLSKNGIEFYEARGEAAFYGPKLDVQALNVFGKEDTISTIQVDFNLPEKFDLTYIDNNNKEKRPFVIHRALIGSFERFFAFLIEFYGGKFPLWLSPEQFVIVPVSNKFLEYANSIKHSLDTFATERNILFRGSIDDKEVTMQARIRDAENRKVNYILIVGEREVNAGTVSVRKRGEGTLGAITIDEFINQFHDEIVSKK